MIDFIGFGFSVLLIVGGVIGYVKAGSVSSLVASAIFAALIAIGAYLVTTNDRNFYLSLASSIVLAGMMGWRFYLGQWKFMPSGLVFVSSLSLAVYYGVIGYLALSRNNIS